MTEFKKGLIFRELDSLRAQTLGITSDSEKIAKLEAPWDATDRPGITSWESWRPYLEQEAEKMDKLRAAGYPTHFWDVTKKLGLDNDKLFGTIQKQNDCTAWACCRCYISLLLRQLLTGSEQAVEAVNQMAIYAMAYDSDYTDGDRIQNGGRTIDAIAQASCESGMFPTSEAGEYDGRCYFTSAMQKTKTSAKLHQIGWCNYVAGDKEQIVKDIMLSVRAGYPVLVGNLNGVKHGTTKKETGAEVVTVSGGWGGGHATSFLDYAKYLDTDYAWWANSHGNLYQSSDGSPSWGGYMDTDNVKSFISGRYFDIKFATYAESTKSEKNNLNPEVLR